ncbi:MAG: J domain-containing protein [Pseudomonadota bacterium]
MTDLERAFEILGIAPTDDEAAIRKAWRGLVRSYHPDTARTDPEGANKRLTEINVAFDAVCACQPRDIQKLKAVIAKRAEMAERMRQQTIQRQKAARAKRQAEQQAEQKKEAQAARASASSKRGADPRQDKPRARSAETAQTSPAVAAPVRKERAVDPDIAMLVSRAEQGFLDAVKACSLKTFLPRKSSYI